MGTDSWYHNADGTPVQFYKVHTGQTFFIRNLQFETMFTPEDVYPWSITVGNNNCAVIRLTVHAHDVAKGSTVTADTAVSATVSNMVLGDIYVRPARFLRATFGPTLKSDMVVTAHHGNGTEGELYELIDAQVVLWTCRAENVRSYTTFYKDNTNINRREAYQILQNTRWLYFISNRALKTHTDTGGGIYNPTMTITAQGIAGLSLEGDVETNAKAFFNGVTDDYGNVIKPGLENVAGSGSLVMNDLSFTNTDSNGDYVYQESGSVVWRGNYSGVISTAVPDPMDWGPLPELPVEPDVPSTSGSDMAPDSFGEEILNPEIH